MARTLAGITIKQLAAATVLAGIILVGAQRLWRSDDARNSPPLDPPPTGANVAVAQEAPAPTFVETAPRVAAGGELQILNANDGQPVPNARLVVAGADPLVRVVGATVGESDTLGLLGLPSGAEDLLVVADGFVPQSVDRTTTTGRQTMRLEPAQPVVVRVLDESGNPVRGATVALQGAGSTRSRFPTIGVGEQVIGNPRHRDPLWLASTDDAGRVRFSEVPPKRFSLRVLSDRHVVQTAVALGREPVTPPADIIVVMEMVWALCARLPDGATVSTWDWLFDGTGLDRSARVSSQLALARAEVERSFPNCICFVGRPANVERPPSLGCRVVTSDGGVWETNWQMQPVDRVQPVFLERQANRTAKRIRFEVMDRNGQPVPIRLAVYAKDDDRHHVVPDNGLLLVDGNYKLMAMPMLPWLESTFADASFKVGVGSPPGDTVVVRMQETFGRLVVDVNPEEEPITVAYHLRLTVPSGRNINIANLTSAERQEFFVPMGKITARLYGRSYQTVDTTVDVSDKAHVSLPLRMKR